MKAFIVTIPADAFFPERYSVDRGDGNRTHPAVDREWCEWLLSKVEDDGRKPSYVVAMRDKPGRPWRKVEDLAGTCDSDAQHRAWLKGLIPCESLQFDASRRFGLFHDSEWVGVQTRQHLKALRIKVRR